MPTDCPVDVEGFECSVLRGLSRTELLRVHMITTEVAPRRLHAQGCSAPQLRTLMGGGSTRDVRFLMGAYFREATYVSIARTLTQADVRPDDAIHDDERTARLTRLLYSERLQRQGQPSYNYRGGPRHKGAHKEGPHVDDDFLDVGRGPKNEAIDPGLQRDQ